MLELFPGGFEEVDSPGEVDAVVAAIFKRVDMTMNVEGKLLAPEGAGRFYDELHAICRKVDTAPPEQVIVGIDDKRIKTVKDLFQVLNTHRIGEKVIVKIVRDGEQISKEITLAEIQ